MSSSKICVRTFRDDFPLYFKHGISFALLTLLLRIIFIDVFGSLVRGPNFIIGAIGVIFISVFMLLGIGLINELLAQYFWAIAAGTSVKRFLSHGLVLFVLISVIGYPATILTESIEDQLLLFLITVAILFLYSFFDGIIAKTVARYFVGYADNSDPAVQGVIRKVCICGKRTTFRPIDVATDGTVICPRCGTKLYTEMMTVESDDHLI